MDQGDHPVEIEVKAYASDLDRVRDRLEALGFDRAAQRVEADTYYQHPGRDFAETDEALRIRRTDDTAFLTYKGPKIDETTKSRREIDTEIEAPESIGDTLEALGFAPVGAVRKDREVYERGELTVTLDEVDEVGTFVEVEQVTRENVDEARQRVRALAGELGLDEFTRRSYLGLLLEKKEKAPG